MLILHCFFYNKPTNTWYDREVKLDDNEPDSLLLALTPQERLEYWNSYIKEN